jgi:hypothetical protein
VGKPLVQEARIASDALASSLPWLTCFLAYLRVGELALAHPVPIGPITAPERQEEQQVLRQPEALQCQQEEWPAQQEQA